MQKGSYAQWTASMLMKNSDQGKYGSQFSMGTNQYPKDILAAVNIITTHQFDKREPKNCWTDKLTDVRRGNVTTYLKMSKEDLWRTVLQSGLISLSIDNQLH
jgi:uncharacterized protein (DUF1919 family)